MGAPACSNTRNRRSTTLAIIWCLPSAVLCISDSLISVKDLIVQTIKPFCLYNYDSCRNYTLMQEDVDSGNFPWYPDPLIFIKNVENQTYQDGYVGTRTQVKLEACKRVHRDRQIDSISEFAATLIRSLGCARKRRACRPAALSPQQALASGTLRDHDAESERVLMNGCK